MRKKFQMSGVIRNKKVPLEYKDYVKYLGVLIDYNLSWKNHIEYITLKISKTVGLVAKLRHYVPLRTLLDIYQSLIVPYKNLWII